jgi:hypothetical protein
MNDVRDEIRELLRDKANEVPPHLEMPTSVTKRVGPRIVRNAAMLAVAAAVVIVVAGAGLRSVKEPTEQSFDTGTPPPATTTTCGTDALQATLALEGAAGSREGSIDLRNTGAARCTLEGRPKVVVFAEDGSQAPISTVNTDAFWQVDKMGTPGGWPVVTLDEGDTATVRFRWSNACDVGTSPTLRVSRQDGTAVAEIRVESFDVPPCNGPDQPSTLEIGPFEPSV